jgi:hypothetical protein
MRGLPLAAVLVCATASLAAAQSAQSASSDPRASHRIKALENLPPIAIEVRPDMRVQAMPDTELTTLLKSALNRQLKDLAILDSAEQAQARAELNIVTAREGGRVQLSIIRPARIAGVADEVFVPVWSDSRLILRGVNRAIIRESIDSLVAAFAADYLQAKKTI